MSVETTDGLSVPLRPRGTQQQDFVSEFESDPVRVADVEAIRVAFDAQKALEAMANRQIPGILGNFLVENVNEFRQFHLRRVEARFRTDKSRFLPEPLNFRLTVQQPDVRLGSDNPFTLLNAAAPSISFAAYRSPEHEDYCRLRELVGRSFNRSRCTS